MQYFILILIIFKFSLVVAEESLLIFECGGNIKADEGFSMPEDKKFSIFTSKQTCKDNMANIATLACFGAFETKESKVSEMFAACEMKYQDGSRGWIRARRETEISAGVGKFIFIGGEGKFSKLVGVSCPYAIQYIDNSNFSILKCRVPKEVIEHIKNFELEK